MSRLESCHQAGAPIKPFLLLWSSGLLSLKQVQLFNRLDVVWHSVSDWKRETRVLLPKLFALLWRYEVPVLWLHFINLQSPEYGVSHGHAEFSGKIPSESGCRISSHSFWYMFTATTQQQNIPSLCALRSEELQFISDSQMVILGVKFKSSKETVRRPKHSFLLNGALQCYCNRKIHL